MSPLARRTSARPVGSGGGRGVVGRNVGTFLQRARSGRGYSARASAGDRAVAAQGELASLCRLLGHRRILTPAVSTRGRSVSERGQDTKVHFMPLSRERIGNAYRVGSIHGDFAFARAS